MLLVEPYNVEGETPDGRVARKTIQPGQYKTQPNHVRTITGKIHYYASPEDTPARMNTLMSWYHSDEISNNVHTLTLAALFHHEFTSIHPFDDGNGRMARILTNLILMEGGYLPIVIEKENKQKYLYCLSNADEGDPEELVEFFAEKQLESISVFIRAAQGETIGELGDFDKRLALLKQKVESEAEGLKNHKSIDVQSNVFKEVFTLYFNNFYRVLKKLILSSTATQPLWLLIIPLALSS